MYREPWTHIEEWSDPMDLDDESTIEEMAERRSRFHDLIEWLELVKIIIPTAKAYKAETPVALHPKTDRARKDFGLRILLRCEEQNARN